MDKSCKTLPYPPFKKNDSLAGSVAFVKELKFCTQDPAQYLQRCIAVSTGRKVEVTPQISRGPNVPPIQSKLRNMHVTKSSFLTEKPHQGTITNMITSHAPDNFYTTQKWPLSPAPAYNHYIANPNGMKADNKTAITENPKKILINLLRSTTFSGNNKNTKSKKRKTKKKKHLKSRRHSPHKLENILKLNKINNGINSKGAKVFKNSETNPQAVRRISKTEQSMLQNSSMINKMLEETEEMLRVTFLSKIHCSSNGSTMPIPVDNLLQNSGMFQLVNSFLSNLLYCARNTSMNENNRQPGYTHTPTTLAGKSNTSIKKVLKSSQSRASTISKRRNSSTASMGMDLQRKSKFRPKKDKLSSIVMGRPGKDDTEAAELAHCTIQPDPPSAVSDCSPYSCVLKAVLPQEPIVSTTSQLPEESLIPVTPDAETVKPNNASDYLQRFREPILDHGNKTKLLPEEYNSQITYIRTSTELNLKGIEADISIDNIDKSGKDNKPPREMSTGSHKVSTASEKSEKKSAEEKKCKTTQNLTSKSNVRGSISKAIGRMFSKTISDKKSLQQRKASDTRNKLSDTFVQREKLSALRSNNKISKKQAERKLYSTSDRRPRSSSSDTSRGSKYFCRQRRLSLRGKEEIRINANASAERRFFNKDEHLMFLARPQIRYVQDTKQRYKSVLDPYHVRNLNTIIICNQAEESRLKRRREELELEAFIRNTLRNRGSRNIFADMAPNNSDASPIDSEHSICTEFDAYLSPEEDENLQDPTEELERKSKLSVILEEQENPEDVDNFQMSVCKNVDKGINKSRLVSGVQQGTFNKPNVHEVEKCPYRGISEPRSSEKIVIQLDYRVSDRFQEEFQDMDVDELRNEDENSFLILRDPEISSKEPEFPAQNMDCLPVERDDEFVLSNSIDSVPSNIITFSTVFEGMETTLKDMKENCSFRSMSSRNYVTKEEIQADCAQALLGAKEANSYPQKRFGQNGCMHIMQCEVQFIGEKCSLESKNWNDKKLNILYHNKKPCILAITDATERKSEMGNKLITINMNYAPFFSNKLDYLSTVLEITPFIFPQELTNVTNLLNIRTKATKIFDNVRNNGAEHAVLNINLDISEYNPIIDRSKSLVPKYFENIGDKGDQLYTVNKTDLKSATSEERVVIDPANYNFEINAGQMEIYSYYQYMLSRGLIDCSPLIPTVCLRFPANNVERRLELRGYEQANLSFIMKQIYLYDQVSYLPMLQNSDTTEKVPQWFPEYLPHYYFNALHESISNMYTNRIYNDIMQNDSTKSKCILDFSDTMLNNNTTLKVFFRKCISELPIHGFSRFQNEYLRNYCHILYLDILRKNGDIINNYVVDSYPKTFARNDQREFDDKTPDEPIITSCSAADISYANILQVVHYLNKVCVENCFGKPKWNASNINENVVSADVRENYQHDITEFRLTSEDISPQGKLVSTFFRGEDTSDPITLEVWFHNTSTENCIQVSHIHMLNNKDTTACNIRINDIINTDKFEQTIHFVKEIPKKKISLQGLQLSSISDPIIIQAMRCFQEENTQLFPDQCFNISNILEHNTKNSENKAIVVAKSEHCFQDDHESMSTNCESSMNKHVAESYSTDTVNYRDCFHGENISDIINLTAARRFHQRCLDDFIDKSCEGTATMIAPSLSNYTLENDSTVTVKTQSSNGVPERKTVPQGFFRKSISEPCLKVPDWFQEVYPEKLLHVFEVEGRNKYENSVSHYSTQNATRSSTGFSGMINTTLETLCENNINNNCIVSEVSNSLKREFTGNRCHVSNLDPSINCENAKNVYIPKSASSSTGVFYHFGHPSEPQIITLKASSERDIHNQTTVCETPNWFQKEYAGNFMEKSNKHQSLVKKYIKTSPNAVGQSQLLFSNTIPQKRCVLDPFLKNSFSDRLFPEVTDWIPEYLAESSAEISNTHGNFTNTHSAECFPKIVAETKKMSQCETSPTKRTVVLKYFFERTNYITECVLKCDIYPSRSIARFLEDSHLYDRDDFCHNALWNSFTEAVKRELNCEPKVHVFRSEVTRDNNSSWHDLTILDYSYTLITPVEMAKSALEGKICEFENSEESTCGSRHTLNATTPFPSLDGVSKITQTNIVIEDGEEYPKRENLQVSEVSSDISSTERKNAMPGSLKFAILALTFSLAFYAFSLLFNQMLRI